MSSIGLHNLLFSGVFGSESAGNALLGEGSKTLGKTEQVLPQSADFSTLVASLLDQNPTLSTKEPGPAIEKGSALLETEVALSNLFGRQVDMTPLGEVKGFGFFQIAWGEVVEETEVVNGISPSQVETEGSDLFVSLSPDIERPDRALETEGSEKIDSFLLVGEAIIQSVAPIEDQQNSGVTPSLPLFAFFTFGTPPQIRIQPEEASEATPDTISIEVPIPETLDGATSENRPTAALNILALAVAADSDELPSNRSVATLPLEGNGTEPKKPNPLARFVEEKTGSLLNSMPSGTHPGVEARIQSGERSGEVTNHSGQASPEKTRETTELNPPIPNPETPKGIEKVFQSVQLGSIPDESRVAFNPQFLGAVQSVVSTLTHPPLEGNVDASHHQTVTPDHSRGLRAIQSVVGKLTDHYLKEMVVASLDQNVPATKVAPLPQSAFDIPTDEIRTADDPDSFQGLQAQETEITNQDPIPPMRGIENKQTPLVEISQAKSPSLPRADAKTTTSSVVSSKGSENLTVLESPKPHLTELPETNTDLSKKQPPKENPIPPVRVERLPAKVQVLAGDLAAKLKELSGKIIETRVGNGTPNLEPHEKLVIRPAVPAEVKPQAMVHQSEVDSPVVTAKKQESLPIRIVATESSQNATRQGFEQTPVSTAASVEVAQKTTTTNTTQRSLNSRSVLASVTIEPQETSILPTKTPISEKQATMMEVDRHASEMNPKPRVTRNETEVIPKKTETSRIPVTLSELEPLPPERKTLLERLRSILFESKTTSKTTPVATETEAPEISEEEPREGRSRVIENLQRPRATSFTSVERQYSPDSVISHPMMGAHTGAEEKVVAPASILDSAKVVTAEPSQAIQKSAQPAPPEENQVLNQITRNLQSRTVSQGSEMRMRLVPENLGEIHLKVTVRDGQIIAEIRASSEVTREVLNKNSMQLQTLLAESGVGMEKVIVRTGNFGSDLQGQYAQQRDGSQMEDPKERGHEQSEDQESDHSQSREESRKNPRQRAWERFV